MQGLSQKMKFTVRHWVACSWRGLGLQLDSSSFFSPLSFLFHISNLILKFVQLLHLVIYGLVYPKAAAHVAGKDCTI